MRIRLTKGSEARELKRLYYLLGDEYRKLNDLYEKEHKRVLELETELGKRGS